MSKKEAMSRKERETIHYAQACGLLWAAQEAMVGVNFALSEIDSACQRGSFCLKALNKAIAIANDISALQDRIDRHITSPPLKSSRDAALEFCEAQIRPKLRTPERAACGNR